MSSITYKTHCILKGCNAKFINSLVKAALNGADITNDRIVKALSIVNSYDMKECNKIIINHGDFHDAYMKLKHISGGNIQSSNKLRFYRQFAFIYVNEIINIKIKSKLDAIKPKINI